MAKKHRLGAVALPTIATPSCGGQIPSLSADISQVRWPRIIGADDIVEVVPQMRDSKASSLAEFMFRGNSLKTFKENGSILIPHELLRAVSRYEKDPKCNNEIRGGGTTNKEAPLWAPSGKNLTTPEKYAEIAKLVNADFVQLMNDYDFDRNVTNSKKRFQKAQKRSEEWVLKQIPLLADKNLILPVSVLPDEKAREFHVKFIADTISNNSNIVAISLNGGSHPATVELDVYDLIGSYLDALSNISLPVICFDLTTPRDILFGLRNGVHMFGGQYSYVMANNHKAIILPNENYSTRKMKEIDFTDQKTHKNDQGKICEDSSVDLSVGYITHLCKVGEILETILVVQHNTDQMEKFLKFLESADCETREKLISLIE